jgi:hypothetical protein
MSCGSNSLKGETAMSKDRIDFKALKERVFLPFLLKEYGKLQTFKADGKGGLKGPCPFKCEREGQSSFSVSPGGKAWYNHDKGCTCLPKNPVTSEVVRGGNVIEFVMIMDGLTLVEAAKKIVRIEEEEADLECRSKEPDSFRVGPATISINPATTSESTTERKIPGRHQTFSEKGLKALALDSEHEAVTALSLDSDAAESLGIGYTGKGMMKGRVAFPIKNLDGELLAYGGIKADGTEGDLWAYPKDFYPELEVIGLDEARAKTAESDAASHGLIVISFDLLEQARVASAMGSDFNLSIAILSDRLSPQQKTAFMAFRKEGFEGNYLLRVRSGSIANVVVDLLQFLPALGFTKLSFFD